MGDRLLHRGESVLAVEALGLADGPGPETTAVLGALATGNEALGRLPEAPLPGQSQMLTCLSWPNVADKIAQVAADLQASMAAPHPGNLMHCAV